MDMDQMIGVAQRVAAAFFATTFFAAGLLAGLAFCAVDFFAGAFLAGVAFFEGAAAFLVADFADFATLAEALLFIGNSDGLVAGS